MKPEPFAIASLFALAMPALAASAEVKAGWTDRVPRGEGSRERFVAPEGKPGGAGTKADPWDLASTLAGSRDVRPGDVVWVAGGAYRGSFEVKLAGAEGRPVIVRAVPGERATILDSPMAVVEPAAYLWLWGLEIAGSFPLEKRVTKQSGSSPGDLPGGGAAGLEIRAGQGCKFIDLAIHDCPGGGMGWWVGSTESEVHGCLIWGNGWKGPDRGHGHCIYTQNRDGVKTISGCILSVPLDGSYTVHAYGSSRAWVDSYLIEDTVAFERGPFLVGGGRPSHGIRVLRNHLHGVDMRIGYGAENEDCEVRGNVVARGTIAIEKYRRAVDEDNVRALLDRRAVLIPGRYDPDRAHLVAYDGARAGSAEFDAAPFLRPGDGFVLKDPRDPFGKPVLEVRCDGPKVSVPLKDEFQVFLVLRDARG